MPRGVKGTVDYTAQLRTVDQRIDKCKRQLTELTRQKQELLAKKEETDMHELYKFMQSSGLSASEALERLSGLAAAGGSEPICL